MQPRHWALLLGFLVASAVGGVWLERDRHRGVTVVPPPPFAKGLRDPVSGKTLLEAPVPEPQLTLYDALGELVVGGTVVDAEGTPRAFATVTISSAPKRTFTTGSDGTFVFENLIAKTYLLTATSELQLVSSQFLDLKENQQDLRLVMEPGRKVQIRVEDGEKNMVAGAAVFAAVMADATSADHFELVCHTNQYGACSLTNQAPLGLLLFAKTTGNSNSSIEILEAGRDNATVVLRLPNQ